MANLSRNIEVKKQFTDCIVKTTITAYVDSELNFKITEISMDTESDCIIFYSDTFPKNKLFHPKWKKLNELDKNVLEYFNDVFSDELTLSDLTDSKEELFEGTLDALESIKILG